jgi:hypothetical protein
LSAVPVAKILPLSLLAAGLLLLTPAALGTHTSAPIHHRATAVQRAATTVQPAASATPNDLTWGP